MAIDQILAPFRDQARCSTIERELEKGRSEARAEGCLLIFQPGAFVYRGETYRLRGKRLCLLRAFRCARKDHYIVGPPQDCLEGRCCRRRDGTKNCSVCP